TGGEGRMIADGDSAPGPADQGDLLKQLDELGKKVKVQEQEARSLKSYFEDQQALLASAPSIWPVRGWVTSDYSVRLDPYTVDRSAPALRGAGERRGGQSAQVHPGGVGRSLDKRAPPLRLCRIR